MYECWKGINEVQQAWKDSQISWHIIKIIVAACKSESVDDFVINISKKYITDFVGLGEMTGGQGLKLIKTHMINHFVECIWLYGSAINLIGATTEPHLKANTKQPAQRTKMWPEDMGLQTAM